jgi:phytanoyl-CoA hydroxylase
MADFKEGDVVFHNPFIIHVACVNTTDRVMIHTDTRYVNPADRFDKRWTVYWDRECITFCLCPPW